MSLKVDVFHHIIFGTDSKLDRKIDTILALLQDIKKSEVIEMKEFDDLVALVNGEQTVIDGVAAAVDGIVAKLSEILAKLADNPTPAQVVALTAQAQAYIDALSADKDKLTAAVANVPA